MPYEEEIQLAKLEQAAVEMDQHEQERHARYAAEDAQIADLRKHEDELHEQGVKVREDMKAALTAALERRKLQEAQQSPEMIAELLARIQHLESAQKPAEPAAPAAPAV